ncbi:MAG TPA: 6-carboxytetrahydropterin synthase [Kofleriaceae bacterium]|nr:6-carboxytetrahydropterin synthase [Kofleriaceae bacterium]
MKAVARRHRVTVRRDQYKFSCAHMTVFPDGTKERLHGHNYQLGLELELTDVSFARMLPFAAVKDCLAALCVELRERVLVAEQNPLTTIVRADDEVELRVCGKRYVFPREDVVLLPIDNVSVEALASHLGDRVVAALAPALSAGTVTALELWVSESPGQGATCRLELEAAGASQAL